MVHRTMDLMGILKRIFMIKSSGKYLLSDDASLLFDILPSRALKRRNQAKPPDTTCLGSQ
uniref:Uncharacterized protein n=1 Tax=Rhizophora mucronata TaxID=61149 RepID=A0A2P2N4F3_RHIMU